MIAAKPNLARCSRPHGGRARARRRTPNSRPASRLAGRKLASGFFRSAPRARTWSRCSQVADPHQSNRLCGYVFASGCAVAANSTTAINKETARITPGSRLGDALRRIPLIGGILGGAGDIASGAFNTVAGIVTFGQSGTFGRGLGQIAGGAGEVVGRVWSIPNTAVGLAYGGVGMLFGAKPQWDSHAGILRFTGLPTRLMSTAMSLGSVNVFGKGTDPDDDNNLNVGVSAGREESLHTLQSRVLGPLYFPLHLLGGTISAFSPDRPGFDWWHRNNFMEEGPMHGGVWHP